VIKYVENAPEKRHASVTEVGRYLRLKGIQLVDKDDLAYLGQAEELQAHEHGSTYFKFGDDAEMLRAIEAERSKTLVSRSAA
jgi:hypothetical protein